MYVCLSGSGDDACQRRRAGMVVLPPEPQSNQEMIGNIADHLTLPLDKPCQRELVLGGEAVRTRGTRRRDSTVWQEIGDEHG